MKDDIPDITDLSARHFNHKRTRQDAATSPGAIVLEISAGQRHRGEHRRRMLELGKLASVQKRVLSRMLERSIEKSGQPKGPHLTVVK